MNPASAKKASRPVVPSVCLGVDLLRNRHINSKVGPFGGKVGAHIVLKGTPCFITTNTDYIPAPAPAVSDEGGTQDRIQLRKDLRWGIEDPIQWPQQYMEEYPHMACIPSRPRRNQDTDIMWWDPTPHAFMSSATGATATRGLGKLSQERLSCFSPLVHAIRHEAQEYLSSFTPPCAPPAMLQQLRTELRFALDRLTSIPSTYTQMVLGVRALQRMYLETVAYLQYMKVYCPRLSRPDEVEVAAGDCIGAFTSNADEAQRLHLAGIPFWYIRPLQLFADENIWEVVRPLDPSESIEMQPAPDFPSVPAGRSVSERLRAYHWASRKPAWHTNPLKADADALQHLSASWIQPSSATPMPGSSSQPSRSVQAAIGHSPYTQEHAATRAQAQQGGDTREGRSNSQRHHPYANTGRGGNNGGSHNKQNKWWAQEEGRNKYEPLDNPYMAPTVPAWERALSKVIRNEAPLVADRPANYLLPEPALLVSSETRRDTYMHHYQLMRDALQYLLGHPEEATSRLLAPQEWRDVLGGKVVKQGAKGSRARGRTAGIEEVLGPAMRACRVDVGQEFPARDIPKATTMRGKEITWELAEMNFRYELPALDARASKLDRVDQCLECFPGSPIGPDLSEGKLGFAAMKLTDRLPYLLRLAILMRDWLPLRFPRPEIITREVKSNEWTTERMCLLEEAVATYYTQSFYEHFGRPAVVPMRIEHELGTGVFAHSLGRDLDAMQESGQLI